MKHTIAVLAVLGLAAAAPAVAQNPTPRDLQRTVLLAPNAFDRLVDEYFADDFRRRPSSATRAGVHDYDGQLEDFSKAGADSNVAALRRFEARFAAIDPGPLSLTSAADREILLGSIRARLLDLEQIRTWQRSPDRYSSAVTRSVYVLMSRNFATPAERLASVIERERRIPNVFADARDNLKNPPRIFTEIAIQQIPGIINFFKRDVPKAFETVTDDHLQAEFAATNAQVIAALERYQTFLVNDLLPRSNGDFRIGAENFRKKLLYEEMVDMPVDRLLKIGMDDLRSNQQRFREVAAKLDPKRTAQQILADLGSDAPAPDSLLDYFRGLLAGLRQFIVEHDIVTVPSEVMPIVQETPPFGRATGFASMDTPGAFEKVAKEAYFNVTLPDPSWPAERVKGHMMKFNRSSNVSIAVHEALPGHYVQFLWVPSAVSKVRKLVGCGTNSEGWAHYTEQMMLDEGYGGGDLRLRLGQLQDALLRDARFIVGLQMHTGRMTMDQAREFFVKEGWQSKEVADRETKRGTTDPTYLVYTLGKLEILRLREDYKKMRGDKFTLQEFHDAFLKQGFPPIKIVRKALLGQDGPAM